MTEKIKEALNALIENKDTDLYEELMRKEDIQEPAFAEEALKQGIFCPAELYKAASPKVRDNLIELLEGEKNNTLNINGILLALAAIGDEVVVEAFKKWEENPPAWRSKIYVGPAEYAMESGWCIENGNKKELTHDSCYALQRVQACETNGNVYGGPSKDRCPHCGSKYEEILVLDGKDSRLAFLGIDGTIKIKTCKACLPWEKYIFSKYEENGESRIIYQESGAGRRIEDENWKTEKCFVLSESSVAKHYCSEWEGSAVGGAPKYVDDANYAICPECGKRMRHLAQLGEEYTGYGNIYVQICKECKITATLYQQS
ncbi:MAG: hypothetical protein J6J42_10010 [Lachnospiraceae bacterium]|nr:hypothetical protein [Lachnospiraceae bacterium]